MFASSFRGCRAQEQSIYNFILTIRSKHSSSIDRPRPTRSNLSYTTATGQSSNHRPRTTGSNLSYTAVAGQSYDDQPRTTRSNVSYTTATGKSYNHRPRTTRSNLSYTTATGQSFNIWSSFFCLAGQEIKSHREFGHSSSTNRPWIVGSNLSYIRRLQAKFLTPVEFF